MPRKSLLSIALASLLNVGPAHAADLLDIYRDALANDAQLKQARAVLDASREGTPQARAGLLPNAVLGASAAYEDVDGTSRGFATDGDSTTTSYSVSLTQPLYRADRWHNFQASKHLTQQAEIEFSDAEQELALRVAEAYFNILRAEDNLSTAQAEETAIKRQLDQAKQQFEVGLIAITGVHEAQAAYDLSRANRISAEGDLLVSFEALEQLTGKRYDSIDALKEEMPIRAPQPLERKAWVDLAIRNNLPLQARQQALEAARRALQASKAGHYPTLDAKLSYAHTEDDLTPETDLDSVSLSVEFALPLYAGGGISSRVRQSFHEVSQAEQALELQRRNVVQQTRSLYTQVNTDVLRVEARKQAILSNQSALEATRTGYEVGTRNIVDVLQAERNLFAAQRDYDNSRYDFIINVLRLKRSAGTLQAADLEQLNEWLTATRGERYSQ